MDEYLQGGEFNFVCMDCNNNGQEYFTYYTEDGEVYILGDLYYIRCPFCGGKAKLIGRPSTSVHTSSLGGIISKNLNAYANDPENLTKLQEAIIDERQKEIRTSSKTRRYLKEQKDRAMKNKAEWVKRGRDPKERSEAVKG